MTTEYVYAKGKIKSFDSNYVFCEPCKWNAVPDQKIIAVNLGMIPANEPRIIHKYEIYDHHLDNGIKEIHRHTYDSEIIDRLVNASLGKKVVVLTH